MTYNLLAGEDEDAVQRLRGATALLQAARPDVLALNECTLLAVDGGARLRALQDALGMQAQLAHAASGYHVALLLRDGVFQQVEPLHAGFAHVALVAAVKVCGRLLRVIALHLDPFCAARRAQEAARVAAFVSTDRTSLLLGDLNAISARDAAAARPEQWVLRYRQRHLDASGQIDTRATDVLQQAGLVDVHAALHAQSQSTRPTARYASKDRPSQRLDYIFASAELAAGARACAVYEHPSVQEASDHFPLYADFEAARSH